MKLFNLLTYIKTINKSTSINSVICKNLIDMAMDSQPVTVDSLSKKANVSYGSVNNFSAYLGYKSFKTLANDVSGIKGSYDYYMSDTKMYNNYSNLLENIIRNEENIMSVLNSNDYLNKYVECSKLLLKCDSILFIGSPRPDNSYFLDMFLTACGKNVYSYINPNDQISLSEKMDSNTAVIVFDIDEEKLIMQYFYRYLSNHKNVIHITFNNSNIHPYAISILVPGINLSDKMSSTNLILNRNIYFMRAIKNKSIKAI